MIGEREMTDDHLRNWLILGTPEAPEAPIDLEAGPLHAELHGAELRHLTFGGVEVAEAVYVAVRDQAWNTISHRVMDRAIDTSPTGFTFSAEVEYRQGDVDLAGTITIQTTHRSITGKLQVTAGSDFEYARIGFNLVHPCSVYVGRSYTARGGRGEMQGSFPELVETIEMEDGFERPLIRAFDQLIVELSEASLAFKFTGDDFETEDQRNYGDNSFKTFSTPLDLPIPFRMSVGEQLSQTFQVRIEPKPTTSLRATGRRAGEGIQVADEPIGALPRIGFLTSSIGRQSTDTEIDLIKRLHPSHLRVDTTPNGDGTAYALALADAAALGVPIELAVPALPTQSDWLSGILRDISQRRIPVVRIIALPDPEGDRPEYAPSTEDLIPLQSAVDEVGLDKPVVPGVATFFAELNRTPPAEIASGVVAAPYSPMVHAWEDEIIISNLRAISTISRTVRERFDASLALSPVTLATRGGPWPRRPISDDVSPLVDPRQMALVGAAWTVSLIAESGHAGVASLTLFETLGPQGVAEHEKPALDPTAFPSEPGALFPLGHVLSLIAGHAGAPLLPLHNLQAHGVAGTAIRTGDGHRIVLANIEPLHKTVPVHVKYGEVQVISIDKNSRGRPSAATRVDAQPGAAVRIHLAPYAVATLDSSS